MAKARSTKVTSLQRKTAQLMVAAPVVVAHRAGRMIRAGSAPTASDQVELKLMVKEKTDAAIEAWIAIASSLMSASQQHLQVGVNAWMNPRTYREMASGRVPRALRTPWSRIGDDFARAATKGLEPVHRRVVANAKRLGG